MGEPKPVIKEFKTGYYLIPDRSVVPPKSFPCNDAIIDPFCDPRTPKPITFHDVTSAGFLIKSGIEKTPCPRSNASDSYGMDLYLKKECLQFTGSFKERGARCALLSLTEEQRKNGVIAASLGNHSQGVCYHGYKLNIPVTVVMPKAASIMKIERCRKLKATVVVEGKDIAEAKLLALKIAKEKGLFFINGYDHPLTMAGQGTVGLEILEQVPNPDAVILPVGGGGLLTGVAVAIKAASPKTLVMGVESANCPAFTRAFQNNGPIATPVKRTIADGLAVPTVGYNAYITCAPLIDKMLVVQEEWIALAILRLVEEDKCVVEGAGATGLAAILAGLVPELQGKKVVTVLSGGNIDTTVFGRCLERGLAAEGRLVKFNIEVPDCPGGINELCDILTSLGVSIKDIMHERAWLRDVYTVEVKVVCETRDWEHSVQLKNRLKESYAKVQFSETPMAIENCQLAYCKKMGEPKHVIKEFKTGYYLIPDHSVPIRKEYDCTDAIADPFCDPKNPRRITFHDVTSAAFLIKGGVDRTPCSRANASESYGMDLYLKKDCLQYTGSFKERGARNALLSLTDEQKKNGVVSASMGNHSQGLSYHGWKLNIPVTVVMPKAASIMKIQRCRNFKANVVVDGKDMAEAKAIALRMAKEKGLLFINGFDHPHILAGQGTMGLEILEQVPNPDAVIIPVGGGGLIAGVATAIKAASPKTLVMGAESANCPGFTRSIEHSQPTLTAVKRTLADGLAVPTVGYNAFASAAPLIDKMLVVQEEWIALAILRLVEEEKCVVEGAGATAFATILAGLVPELRGKKVVVVMSGGNIDTTMFGRCLERGLAAEGRLVKFIIGVPDCPGGINGLCDILTNFGVSIKDIMHERAWLRDVYTVEVKVVCETRDWEHSMELKNKLKETYAKVQFSDTPMAIANRQTGGVQGKK